MRVPFAALAVILLADALPGQCGFQRVPSPTAGRFDEFGFAVAMDGDVAAVGNFGDGTFGGAVHVYRRSAQGWRFEQSLRPAPVQDIELFGVSVDVSGDTIAVGATGYRRQQNDAVGAAYVFERSSSGWVQRQRLVAPDAAILRRFGEAVAIDQDVLVVGDPDWETRQGVSDDQGAAYVYRRSAGGFAFDQRLTASDAQAADRFGTAVAVSGRRLLIGRETDPAGHVRDQGAAYVFAASAAGWVEEARLRGEGTAFNDRFGFDVALSGDRALVGSPGTPVRAYVFERTASGWQRVGSFTEVDAKIGYGRSVAIEGDWAVVGDQYATSLGDNARGSTFVYRRTQGAWVRHAQLYPRDAGFAAFYGIDVAISGRTFLAGATGGSAFGGSAQKVYFGCLESRPLNAGPAYLNPAVFFSSQVLSIDAGAQHAGRTYAIAGSLSGTTPGTVVDGVHVPLNVDLYTELSLLSANAPPFRNSFGTLDGLGRAAAEFETSALDRSAVGLTLHHVALVLSPNGLALATNAARLELVDP